MKQRTLTTLLALGLLTAALPSCRPDDVREPAGSTLTERSTAPAPFILDGQTSIEMPRPNLIPASAGEDNGQRARTIELRVNGDSPYPTMEFNTATKEVNPKGITMTTNQAFTLYTLVILRSPDNKTAYYADKPQEWLLIPDTTKSNGDGSYRGARVLASTDITSSYKVLWSTEGKTADLTPAEMKGKTDWHLDAIYLPGLKGGGLNFNKEVFDPETKRINFRARMPGHFFQPGERVILGIDLDVPFILRSAKRLTEGSTSNRSNMLTGIPVKQTEASDSVKKRIREQIQTGYEKFKKPDGTYPESMQKEFDKRYQINPNIYTLSFDKDYQAIFQPMGTLMCLQFANRMGETGVSLGKVDDSRYKSELGKTLTKFDYIISGVGVGSNIATTYGYWDLGQSLQIGKDPTWGVADQNSFDAGTDFEARHMVDFRHGSTTGWYYIWMNNLPADKQAKDGATNFYLNLYNRTWDLEMQSFRAFSTSRAVNGGNSQSLQQGRMYYHTANLDEALRPIPLMLMGQDFISFDRNNAMFANPNAPNEAYYMNSPGASENKDPKGGMGYNATNDEIYTFAGNEVEPFKVRWYDKRIHSYPNFGDEGVTTASDLKWILPDELTVYSVFPYRHDGILNNIYEGHYTGLNHGSIEVPLPAVGPIVDRNERMRIEGILYQNQPAVYYRKPNSSDIGPEWVTTTDNSAGRNTKRKPEWPQRYVESVNVCYAIRNVGTPYAAAYRYIQAGKWVNGRYDNDPWGQGRPNVSWVEASGKSRFIIQSKRISPKVGMSNGSFDETAAKNYLVNEVAQGAYWTTSGDEADYGHPLPDVISRTIHVPGFFQGGDPSTNGLLYGGRSLRFWVYVGGNENNFFNFKFFTLSSSWDGQKAPYGMSSNEQKQPGHILPWLAPVQTPTLPR